MKIVLSLLVTLAVLSLPACGKSAVQLTQEQKNTAELGAKDYFSNMGGKFGSCSPVDSDADDYTTCTGQGSDGKTKQLSCGYANGATGCKDK